jgi:hypothetical protein
MLVASNNYSTHEFYPELEGRAPVGPGEAFDFVFIKQGVSGYHNHSKPQHKASVIVD